MNTLLDHFKYNNVPYNKLKDCPEKQKLERFAKKLEEKGLSETILSFNLAYEFNPRHFLHHDPPHFPDFKSGFPQDLSYKMITIWIRLDD